MPTRCKMPGCDGYAAVKEMCRGCYQRERVAAMTPAKRERMRRQNREAWRKWKAKADGTRP